MDTDNRTVLLADAAVITAAISGTVNALGVWGNIITIIFIARTAGMRGYSGALMINQAVAEVMQEILSLVAMSLFLVRPRLVQLDIHIRLALFGLCGVISQSLSALSANLYLAICKQRRYKNMVTWNRFVIFLGCSWTFNSAIVCMYHFDPSFYVVDQMSHSDVLHINPTYSNCWFLILWVLNVAFVPLCTSATCFLKIRSNMKHPTMANLSPHNMDKVMLAQTVHIMTIIYLITLIPVIGASSVEVRTPGVKALFWAISSSFYILKLLIYVKLYTPFRETTKAMCCNFCQNRVGHIDHVSA